MRKLTLSILLVGMAAISGCGEDYIPQEPVGELRTEIRGYKSPPDVMMSANYKPTWIQYAVSGYKRMKGTERPGSIHMVNRPRDCKFASLKMDSVVKYVAVEGSTAKSLVWAANKADLDASADRALDDISRLKPGQKPERVFEEVASRIGGFGVVDVVVGKSRNPVYLVLMSSQNTIWNIMVSPNTSLDHVAVIGNGKSAIANLPDNVPYEFLDGQSLRDCDVFPIRQPRREWQLVENAKTTAAINDALNENFKKFQAYRQWFEAQFGSMDDAEWVSSNQTSHFLVGKIPSTADERPAYNSLEGANVIMPKAVLATHAGRDEFRAQFANMINQRALQKAGKI